MNIKKNTGLAGIDVVIAVIAVIIFTTLILAIMSSNAKESVKIAKETMAMVYITEIFENIGIADFDEVTEENKENFIPDEVKKNYNVELVVKEDFEEIEETKEKIIKKIELKLTYQIGNKTYSCSAERLKSKE